MAMHNTMTNKERVDNLEAAFELKAENDKKKTNFLARTFLSKTPAKSAPRLDSTVLTARRQRT
eukprot:3210844-Prymnesium_polylepis.3